MPYIIVLRRRLLLLLLVVLGIFLADDVKQFSLEDELALLVLFRCLVGLVILPADNLVADAAADVAHDVAARGHVALARLGTFDVDDGVEQVCLTMLAAEVLVWCGLLSTRMDQQMVCEGKGGGSSSCSVILS